MKSQKLLDSVRNQLNQAFSADDPREFDYVHQNIANGFALLGAGSLGRRTLQRLRGLDLKPVAVADNFRQGETVEGFDVVSPENLIKQFGCDICVVISIWQGGESTLRFGQIKQELFEMGFMNILSIFEFYCAFPETFLPYLICELPSKTRQEKELIFQLLDLVEDDESLQLVSDHVNFRLSGTFDLLKRSPGIEYFDETIVDLSGDVTFLDLGAFDGDTIRTGLEIGVPFSKVVAVEPDPSNFSALLRWVATEDLDGLVKGLPVAVSDISGDEKFVNFGDMTSRLENGSTGERGLSVKVARVDDLCGELSFFPTHIKMDVEGAEKKALVGMAGILKEKKPSLMIALEHNFDDLWSIPILINRLQPEYRFHLRHYSEQGFDVVMYATPK